MMTLHDPRSVTAFAAATALMLLILLAAFAIALLVSGWRRRRARQRWITDTLDMFARDARRYPPMPMTEERLAQLKHLAATDYRQRTRRH